MTTESAFSPLTIGRTHLRNRLVMSAMTRSRATGDGRATADIAEYYRQRTGAGLLVTETTQISTRARSYPTTPGIHSTEQAASWERVAEVVHDAGSAVYLQLFHGGRVGDDSMRGGLAAHAPSAVAAPGKSFTPAGLVDHPVPTAMTDAEIRATIREFAGAARLAVGAGFDGVQLHGANGYLPHQFLGRSSNLRTDDWGGSAANRVRFTVETIRAMADAVGPDRVSLRISPAADVLGVDEEGTEELYGEMLSAVDGVGLAFLDVVEAVGQRELTQRLRKSWSGVLALNPHRDAEPAPPHEVVPDALDSGADLVVLGKPWLANPDLDRRIASGGPYNEPDHTTFYGGTAAGFLDYPALAG
ncbi:oxidoreductase [Prauserella cavernicola]|uniref:Alkene reductase n=1 Tax=Prauserella cavernicola TaxID=2800127 RepID=A0A934V7C5_9PSEU|nr:alkene reductase [Prauserella cavernicola]MBK1787554.1 alkene reductase [Prauserella cavernicola]